jgi:hypothetical protein
MSQSNEPLPAAAVSRPPSETGADLYQRICAEQCERCKKGSPIANDPSGKVHFRSGEAGNADYAACTAPSPLEVIAEQAREIERMKEAVQDSDAYLSNLEAANGELVKIAALAGDEWDDGYSAEAVTKAVERLTAELQAEDGKRWRK